MIYSLLGTNIIIGEDVSLHQKVCNLHTYIIGQTGAGKRGLIQGLLLQDVKQEIGVGLIDLAGNLTEAILARRPRWRWRNNAFTTMPNIHRQ